MPSCQSRNEGIKNIVKEWMGKEITIHSEAKFKTLGKDTLCYDLWNKPYKIFTYIDSVGCTGCRLNLQRWESFIDGCRQQQIDIGFIFVVHSSDFSIFDDEIRFKEFDYPVIYDYHNDFEKLNHFPPDPYRTFLLDKDNKVQLIGSPVNNPQMWELYKEIITQSQ
jgi:hypothetical protein